MIFANINKKLVREIEKDHDHDSQPLTKNAKFDRCLLDQPLLDTEKDV